MSTVPFLNNRQIGFTPRSGFKTSYCNLNLDNLISRLACQKKNIFTTVTEGTEVPPFVCKFSRDQSDILAVANEDGDISLYETSGKQKESLLKTFQAHHNAIYDICWLPNKCQLISGAGDSRAMLWDIPKSTVLAVFKKHTESIKSVDVCREQSAVFATGSRDGSINIWDTRERNSFLFSKPAINICQAHFRKNNIYSGRKTIRKTMVSNVSAVAFQDSNNLASAAVADGVIKVWDLRRTYISNPKYLPTPRYQMNYSKPGSTGSGCTSLVFDSRFRTLYACSTSNKILKFDCYSYTKEDIVYEGFQCATYFVKLALSYDDKYLLCGSSDDKAYIWKTSKPGLPIVQLGGHSAEVTSVCWSSYDITKLATCGDDYKVAVWKVENTETFSDNENIYAVAESYCESSKNSSPLFQNTGQNSITSSKITNKRSPAESTQTPRKPSMRVITNFFSPVTPVQTCTNHIQNQVTVSDNNSPSPRRKSPNENSIADSSSQILTPCNHINKNNIKHQTLDDNLEAQSSSSNPENNNNNTSFLHLSSSVQNKENASTDSSPEIVQKISNVCQTKRKLTSKLSTPSVKRKQTEISKSKGAVKMNKKNVAGKTIMSYFSVVLSSDN